MTRIKDRARRKAALSDRKSAAAQARMKSIANLALDDRVPKKEKRRKGGGGEPLSVPFTYALGLVMAYRYLMCKIYRRHIRRRRCGLGNLSQDCTSLPAYVQAILAAKTNVIILPKEHQRRRFGRRQQRRPRSCTAATNRKQTSHLGSDVHDGGNTCVDCVAEVGIVECVQAGV